jgi:hypothetical protein
MNMSQNTVRCKGVLEIIRTQGNINMDVARIKEGKMRKTYKMSGSHHKGIRPLWRSKCT